MKKLYAFIAALAIQILFSNSAQANNILYLCRGELGVGLNTDNLSPITFQAQNFKITKYNSLIGAEIYHNKNGWEYIGGTNDQESGPDLIRINSAYTGIYFELHVGTGRFSFLNAKNFMIGNSSAPYMYAGTCKKQ